MLYRSAPLSCAWFVIFVGCGTESAPEAPIPITSAEASAISGGVSVDIVYPPNNSSQTHDNPLIVALVTSDIRNQPSYVSLWADNTKVGNETYHFVGNETKSYSKRVRWPFPGRHDAQFKFYYSGQYYEAGPDSGRPGLRVHPSVKVRPIRFWNVRHKSSISNVSSSFLTARVDASDTDRSKTADNIDGIFSQCGGTDRTQFRSQGVAPFTPSYNPGVGLNCSDLRQVYLSRCSSYDVCPEDVGGGVPPESQWACPQLGACLTAYAAQADSYDDQRGFRSAHVFNIERTACNRNGENFVFKGTDNVTRSFVLMQGEYIGSDASEYTKVLAHELLHDSAGHNHCDQPGPNGCNANQCNSNDPSVRNLMCKSGVGRDLTSAQCDSVKDMHWADLN